MDHLLRYAIARLEELARESLHGDIVIEMRQSGEGAFVQSTEQVDFYKMLLEKFKEFAKIYGFEL